MLRENAAKEGARNTSAIVASARWKCLEESVEIVGWKVVEENLELYVLRRVLSSFLAVFVFNCIYYVLDCHKSVRSTRTTKIRNAEAIRNQVEAEFGWDSLVHLLFCGFQQCSLQNKLEIVNTHTSIWISNESKSYIINKPDTKSVGWTLRTFSSNHDPLWSSCHDQYLFLFDPWYLMRTVMNVYMHIYTIWRLYSLCFLLAFLFLYL